MNEGEQSHKYLSPPGPSTFSGKRENLNQSKSKKSPSISGTTWNTRTARNGHFSNRGGNTSRKSQLNAGPLSKRTDEEYKEFTSEKLRDILFKTKKIDRNANYDANGNIKAKVSTFDTTQQQLKKIVIAQKTGLGQVQVSTALVKEENEEDGDATKKEAAGTIASSRDGGDDARQSPFKNRKKDGNQALLAYLKAKHRAHTIGKQFRGRLVNGVPCKVDGKNNPIIDPLKQPPKKKNENEPVDPTEVNQPYFEIEGSNGMRMLYREESVKNLMNNSIVRYNDPAALEVSHISLQSYTHISHYPYFHCLQKAKNQFGTTVRFQFSCICKGGRS